MPECLYPEKAGFYPHEILSRPSGVRSYPEYMDLGTVQMIVETMGKEKVPEEG
jgi:hypothetical protein